MHPNLDACFRLAAWHHRASGGRARSGRPKKRWPRVRWRHPPPSPQGVTSWAASRAPPADLAAQRFSPSGRRPRDCGAALAELGLRARARLRHHRRLRRGSDPSSAPWRAPPPALLDARTSSCASSCPTARLPLTLARPQCSFAPSSLRASRSLWCIGRRLFAASVGRGRGILLLFVSTGQGQADFATSIDYQRPV